MESPKLIISQKSCQFIAAMIAGFVVFVGVLVMIGWLFNIPVLTKINPGWESMKFNTALCFVLSGIGLWLVRNEKHRGLTWLCAGIIILISTLTLVEYLFAIDLTLDQWVVSDHREVYFPGRMPFITAVNFILLGLAFLFINNTFNKQNYQWLILPVVPLTLIGLLMYMFHVNPEYWLVAFFYMSFMTPILFILMCIGLLMVRPDVGISEVMLADDVAGRFVQRVILLAWVIPILIGYLAGYAEMKGIFDCQFGNVFIVVAYVVIASCIIYFNAYLIRREEAALHLAKESLKISEDLTKKLAQSDSVTGFLNRNAMESEVNQLMKNIKIPHAAVIVIDIESYDKIIKALGLDAGVLLLQLIADRIKKDVLSENDIISRLENNKLAIFTQSAGSTKAVVEYTKKILDIFKSSYFLFGETVFVTEQIGIALLPGDATYIKALLDFATIASDVADEDLGGDRVHYYSEKLPKVLSEKLKMEMALRHAITHAEFELYYQPQNDLKTGKIIAYEALIRWVHPKKGIIMPSDFIPLAEETGLIVDIDEWVLRAAFEKVKQSFFKGKNSTGLVSVNISAKHFRDPYHLLATLKCLIEEFNVSPSEIEIEVTEGVLLYDSEKTFSVMREIAELGFHFSLDDFGTGYSSLSYLHRIPTNKIKIDKSFIDRLPNDKYSMAIVKSIILLSHNLGKSVIAEGVETVDQVKFLKDAGCDGMQGYYFSKPLPVDKIKTLIHSNKILKLPD